MPSRGLQFKYRERNRDFCRTGNVFLPRSHVLTAKVSSGRSRLALYLPFAVLILLAVGISVAWFVISNRVEAEMDRWLAREASAGRAWSCPGRSIAGFPFRIELRCAGPQLAVTRGVGVETARAEGLVVVGQVYRWRHIIAEIDGPLRMDLIDGTKVEADWRDLRLSAVAGSANDGLERLSLIANAGTLRVTPPAAPPDAILVQEMQLHLRRDPRRFAQDGAYDIALRGTGVAAPGLDAVTGEAAPMDVEAVILLAQALRLPGGPLRDGLERWRQGGGRLDLKALNATKGQLRLRLEGTLALDEARRPMGRIDGAATGHQALLTRLLGGNAQAGTLIAGGLSLLGRPKAAAAGNSSATPDDLTPLPSLRFENGRVMAGPFNVGRLAPLY
jgi:hypothetical protein